MSSEEFLKQAGRYGLNFEDDFLDYLRGLSFKERRAFDMAMGYVFAKVSDLKLHLPKTGLYVFLKASDEPLGPFYNEHRDRRALFATATDLAAEESVCLDRSNEATFDDGWYEPNMLPPVARWMTSRGRVSFRASGVAEIRLDLTTHLPDLGRHPLGLEIFLNRARLSAFSLFRYGWLELRIPVPEEIGSKDFQEFELELRADHTWQPRPVEGEGRDDRELSIAVCNLVIHVMPNEAGQD